MDDIMTPGAYYVLPEVMDTLMNCSKLMDTLIIPGETCSYVFDRYTVRSRPDGGYVMTDCYTGPKEAFPEFFPLFQWNNNYPTWGELVMFAHELDKRRRETLGDRYCKPFVPEPDDDLPGDAWTILFEEWGDEDADT